MSEQLPERAWFSPLLNEIADVAGDRAALLLGREKACCRIFIPKNLKPGHWLVELVGDEAAGKLVKRYADSYLDIPPALGGQMRRRRRAITDMTMQGWSIARITRALGVARSTVTDQRRKIGRPAPQDDLFSNSED
ncbi:hypothetical protein GB927_012775 [Shinella sp. CPCC 100929]|uniref:Helix-turn-helix domain-containing protein n=1 Tax=Shinella lacus TaxID=2654216 RepID=A0ABT1R783_9HYPH|nr:hypothetical protein [Shinella lacus]MCQ4630919.1 hypothetical protein [Shinella lacus]